MFKRSTVLGYCLLALPLTLSANSNTVKIDQAVNKQLAVEEKGIKSQKKVEGLDDQARDLMIKYYQTQKQLEQTQIYHQQLSDQIQSQEDEKVSIASQLESIKELNVKLLPLMQKMKDTLGTFFANDLPFLKQERTARLATIDKDMKRADITQSEKFRRILEAYQVENEYGRTIEVYRGLVKQADKDLTVDFLRIGRIALFYQTLDGKNSFTWSQSAGQWQALDSDLNKNIDTAIRVAKKQQAPELLSLPIQAAEVL
jgi:hypothetical protein